MKKILACFAVIFTVIVSAVVSGCKSIPTTDKLFQTSYAVGVASGMIVDVTKIDDTSRNTVISIMNEVEVCVPQTNQTFKTAWTPIAESHCQKLLDEGKIDETQNALILSVFGTAVSGIDYFVNVRYPQVRQYQDMMEAVVHGFCTGFLTQFKPANFAAGTVKYTYDIEAYEYLKSVKVD